MIALEFTAKESVAFSIGQWVGVLLFSVPAAAALQKAIKTPPGSLRYAYLSAFLGLLLFVQIEVPLDLRNSGPGMLFLVALLRGIAAAAGLICFLRAMVLRGKDKGVGWLGPCVALLICGVHGLYALSVLAVPRLLQSGSQGEAWEHRCETDGYSITLPGKQWIPTSVEGTSSSFRCRTLPVGVVVFARRETPKGFEETISTFKAKELPRLLDSQSESGRTPAGHEYVLTQGTEKMKTKEVRVTICHIYRPEWGQTLIVLSEATPDMKSQMGQAAQRSTIENAVRSIMMSVK